MTSKIYTFDGDLIDCNELYENKPFFRKMTNCVNELEICRILSNYPHSNIVRIYRIGNNYVDMELLSLIDEKSANKIEIRKIMNSVKDFLQKIGIIYVDWKIDNMGLTTDGVYKLFDFDASGIMNTTTLEWIKHANPFYYAYRTAVDAGFTGPIEIDNFSFDSETSF
jgi:serine/threonine protein kinase